MSWKKTLFWSFLIILLSLLEYRLMLLSHIRHLQDIVQASLGITLGEPHWRVYQNRLLGPFSVKYLSEFFQIAYIHMYMFVVIGLHVVKNLVFFYFVTQLTKNYQIAARYTLFFVATFLLLQDVSWLYLWDYLDIITYTFFIYGILSYKKTWYFWLVFAVALINKESALFITLWMMLDALIAKKQTGYLSFQFTWSKNLPRLFSGLILFTAGVMFVEYVREALFVKSVMGEGTQFTGIEHGKYAHVKFFQNIDNFVINLHSPTFLLNFLVDIFLFAIPLFIFFNIKKLNDATYKLSAIFLLIFTFIFVFGFTNETRVYNILIPFFIFLTLAFSGNIKKTSL